MKYKFEPDYCSRPGETLLDLMIERFSDKLAVPEQVLEGILFGEYRITPDLAESLELAGCGCAEFWLARQKHYDKFTGWSYDD